MDTSLPTGQRGKILALAITGTLLLLIWLVLISPLIDFYSDQADTLQQRSEIALRMTRLAQRLPDLRNRVQAASSEGTPTVLTLEGSSDAIAAATLQNTLQDMAKVAGASVSSIEIVPAESVGSYRRIGLKLSLNVPWAVLVGYLQTITQASPPMLIDDLEIHASPLPNNPSTQSMDASFTVYAFRAVAPASHPS